MRFSAFYFLSGAMFSAGAILTPAKADFGWLFLGSVIVACVGAFFEAANPKA